MTVVSGPASLDRHVLLVTVAGSFTLAGQRLTGPVTSVDKLATLISWAYGRDLLQPLPAPTAGSDNGTAGFGPARIWVIGAACRKLVDAADGDDDIGLGEQIGRSLAALVTHGWELRAGPHHGMLLSRGSAAQRICVEIVAEPRPWLAGGAECGDDPAGLGHRLTQWWQAVGTLPASTGADSAAVLADEIMRARIGRRGGGAVISTPGVLPSNTLPEIRIQPPWCETQEQVEREIDRADELVWLQQHCPQLASAGMLNLGYGQPSVLQSAEAASAAQAPKRPFGLWRATLPPATSLHVPDMLPMPHPQMRFTTAVQAWLTTEDLDGLGKDVRDGGAGVAVHDLNIDQAVVWPQQGRVLESWATRLRQARENLADESLRALVESAAADYLDALADPQRWTTPGGRHHFQPAWAAAIAAHSRLRGRRVAMRISREYRVWPIYARDTGMIYALVRDETGSAIDLSDTHTRLGRMVTTRRAVLSEQTILAIVLAQNASELADALTAALQIPARHTHLDTGLPEPAADNDAADAPTDGPHALAQDQPGQAVESGPPAAADAPVCPGSTDQGQPAATAQRSPLGAKSAPTKAVPVKATGAAAAAVLHTDGLWLADGTHVEIDEPILHVGQVAELAYTHHIGYQLTTKYAEPGQIWITDEACRAFGIDVDAISRRDRAKSLRQLTDGIDFVTLAVTAGWSLGGGGEDPAAARLGTWTRVYRDGKRGVLVALIPGMGDAEEMPILFDSDPTPARIARRLQILADALRFPWKINAGVTAVDLMLQTRTKRWSPLEWRDVVFAPSTTTPPFGIGDVESDFDWSRPPTSEEAQRRYVHAYDRGGSYVAGIAGLELPIGDPIHHPDGTAFDTKTPGYWLANIPESADWRLPYVLNPRGLQFTGPKWVCTPTLERAIDLGYRPEILEAWTWPTHGRVLLGWYERFRDASTTLDTDNPDDQAARNQAKIIRTHGIGIIGSAEHLKGKPAYSPERRLHIVAKAKANIAYRLHQIGEQKGQWPLAVSTDTVLYASDNPDPTAAWPGDPATLGRRFGQYKPEATGLLAEHLTYLNGRDYRGKRHLTPADQWRKSIPDPDQPSHNDGGRS